jgi:hypothetical protein
MHYILSLVIQHILHKALAISAIARRIDVVSQPMRTRRAASLKEACNLARLDDRSHNAESFHELRSLTYEIR